MAGSRAVGDCEPGQIRKEAALSGPAHAPRTNLAGATRLAGTPERPSRRRVHGPSIEPMATDTPDLMQVATERLNKADFGGFAELLDPEVVIYPDPSWPEPGPFEGREAMMGFVQDWTASWESVRLEVDDLEERGDWVVSRCRWVTTGKASGATTQVPFTFLIKVREGRLVTVKAFFDHAEALRSLG
jgi:ketosteroid isomerase-like protein